MGIAFQGVNGRVYKNKKVRCKNSLWKQYKLFVKPLIIMGGTEPKSKTPAAEDGYIEIHELRTYTRQKL